VSGKKTILLVDDDPLVCEMTQTILERLGYKAVTAMSAEEARTTFTGDPRLFDLIMIDHVLTDGSGVQLADELSRIRPDIPMVLYTGGPAVMGDIQSKAIRGIIRKGLTKGELAAALGRIFDEERHRG